MYRFVNSSYPHSNLGRFNITSRLTLEKGVDSHRNQRQPDIGNWSIATVPQNIWYTASHFEDENLVTLLEDTPLCHYANSVKYIGVKNKTNEIALWA